MSVVESNKDSVNNNDKTLEIGNDQQIISPFQSIILKLLNPDEITGKRNHRIDEKVLSKFTKEQIDRNAIHGTLAGGSKINTYHIYGREDGIEIAALIEIGDRLCGHPEIVHGGIISAIFDNSFGWLFIASKQTPAFTANLSVNFRKPIYSNANGVIFASVEKTEGRKIYMIARWEWNGEVYADATALFIRPKEIV